MSPTASSRPSRTILIQLSSRNTKSAVAFSISMSRSRTMPECCKSGISTTPPENRVLATWATALDSNGSNSSSPLCSARGIVERIARPYILVPTTPHQGHRWSPPPLDCRSSPLARTPPPLLARLSTAQVLCLVGTALRSVCELSPQTSRQSNNSVPAKPQVDLVLGILYVARDNAPRS
jgi:hypothetical protein